jgi:hypothetical protein
MLASVDVTTSFLKASLEHSCSTPSATLAGVLVPACDPRFGLANSDVWCCHSMAPRSGSLVACVLLGGYLLLTDALPSLLRGRFRPPSSPRAPPQAAVAECVMPPSRMLCRVGSGAVVVVSSLSLWPHLLCWLPCVVFPCRSSCLGWRWRGPPFHPSFCSVVVWFLITFCVVV